MLRGPYRQKWDQDAMDRALQAVRRDGMKHATAAKTFRVPRSSLIDRLKGRIGDSAVMGARTVLNAAEEEQLVHFIAASSKAGFPLQCTDLRKWVKQILDKDGRPNPFKENMPGK